MTTTSFNDLRHYDGTPAPCCPCCGAPWDHGAHAPVKETRGWNAERSVPAWAWTCAECVEEST